MGPKKVDRNQAEIVAALRAAGVTVQHLHTVGRGCPDLIAGYRGRNYLLEVKAPGGRLTPSELEWRLNWQGQSAIIFSAEEALRIMGVIE